MTGKVHLRLRYFILGKVVGMWVLIILLPIHFGRPVYFIIKNNLNWPNCSLCSYHLSGLGSATQGMETHLSLTLCHHVDTNVDTFTSKERKCCVDLLT